jgi:hypothetical protein
MKETDVLEYKDFNGESPNDDVHRLLRVFLRPSNSVFAQPKFCGKIEFLNLLNITEAHYSAILVDFDIS